MILFFDIDGTLLSTAGSGMAAMLLAAKDAFGDHFTIEGLSFAGCLDPVIVSDMLAMNNIADTAEHHRLIREGYFKHLKTRLNAHDAQAGKNLALPGVRELLESLAPKALSGEVVLSLLTGNYAESGTHKLRACGIDPGAFMFGVWGDDAPHSPRQRGKREDLVPVGLARATQAGAKPRRPGEFVVIGDTPHDVRCATVHGGRCLAVATGHYSVHELETAGAHWAVENLSDTRAITRWLLNA